MGGSTFDKTNRLDQNKFDEISEFITVCNNYVLPFRLQNKNSHGDFDIIVSDTDPFIELFKNSTQEIKRILLFKEKFNDMYSDHILTTDLYQIDLLKCWSAESLEITRAYSSYSFANIFLKRMTDIVSMNLKFSFLGIICSSNKFVIPNDVKIIQIDSRTKLIIDCEYVFGLLDLDYSIFVTGFKNEIKLLEFFEKSKYYNQIKFRNCSKFRHDYNRLKPFKNLVDLGLIKVENFP